MSPVEFSTCCIFFFRMTVSSAQIISERQLFLPCSPPRPPATRSTVSLPTRGRFVFWLPVIKYACLCRFKYFLGHHHRLPSQQDAECLCTVPPCTERPTLKAQRSLMIHAGALDLQNNLSRLGPDEEARWRPPLRLRMGGVGGVEPSDQ